MKHKQTVSVGLHGNRYGTLWVFFHKRDKVRPKGYRDVTETSARRLSLYIWRNQEDFVIVPDVVSLSGWFATRKPTK